MKIFNKTTRVFVALVFTFIQVTSSLGNAQIEDRQILEEMIKIMPTGSKTGVNTTTKNVNGVTVITKQFWGCEQNGRCHYLPKETYTTTNVLVQRDGQFYATQTIDRLGDKPALLAYSTVSAVSPTRDVNNIDPTTVRRLDFNPNSPIYSEVVKYLPQISVGVINTIQNFNQISETSEALQNAYNNVLQQVAHAADGLNEIAHQREQAVKLRSALVGTAIAVSLGDSKSFANSVAYQEYLKSYNDPYSHRQYDLNQTALDQHYGNLTQALKSKQARAAIEHSKILFNQRNPEERERALQQFSSSFKDNVLQTHSFGIKSESPFDGSAFRTGSESPEGQIVRNIANKSQAIWIESRGLESATEEGASAYLMGAAALRSADEHFASGDSENGFALAKIADGLLDLTRGASRGLVNSLTQTAKAFPALGKILADYGNTIIEDPDEAFKIAGHFVEALPGLAENIVLQKVALANRLATGTNDERGEALGELTGDLLIAWITSGTLSVAKTGVQGVRVAEKMGRLNQITRTIAIQGLEKSKQLTSEFIGPRGNALIAMARQNPQAAIETVYTMGSLASQGRRNGMDFLGKALANGSRTKYLGTPNSAQHLAKTYIQIEDALSKITPVSFSGKITRGIPASVEINGRIIKNSAEDAFSIHDGMKYANGRYSIGGPEGERALYAVVDNSDETRRNILKEIDMEDSSKVIFVSKEITLAKGLDLSNTQTLQALGISNEQILMHLSNQPNEYLWSQVIGHASRQHGFDFIIAPSAVDPSMKNIILKIKE